MWNNAYPSSEAMRLTCGYARPFGATKNKKMKLLITILLILNFGIANSQNYKIGDSLFVNANGGLNLRQEANAKSKIISLLSFGEKVFIKSKINPEKSKRIGLMEGNWVEIRTGKFEGFVFDAYLSKFPVINSNHYKDPNKNLTSCFINSFLSYASDNIGIKDTILYRNFSDGEGYRKMTIYELKGGHQLIEHGFTESYQIELQLVNIRKGEAIQLFKNVIIQSCGQYEKEIIENITKIGTQDTRIKVDSEDGFCIILTKGIKDRFIITMYFGY